MDDTCEAQERLGLKTKFFEHHIERAQARAAALEAVLDSEGRGLKMLRDVLHFGGRYEKKYGISVNELTDEPRAGDAHHLWPGACDPYRAPGRIPFWKVPGP